MDSALKHRLIGAAVLSALAIIFLPMLIVGRDKNSIAADVPLTMPTAPAGDFQTRELPLVAPAPNIPAGGVVGMSAAHPAGPAASGSAASPPVDAKASPMTAGAQSTALNASATKAPATRATGATAVPVAGSIASPAAAAANPTAAAASPASAVVRSPALGSAPQAMPATPPTSSAASNLPAPNAMAPNAAATAATNGPIPAANAGGHYVVSLGTYSNAANAQSLVASLKGSQLPAYAESVSVAGKQETRVRIGPFGQRGDAEAARLKAQQLRKDMKANVTALDAAAPAPDVPTAPANKSAATPATSKAASIKAPPTTPATPAATAASTATPAASSGVAAPAAVKTAAAPSPAAAGRGYAVQVSAYRSEDEAVALRNKLKAAGFTAFSERIQAESGTLYRVRIGPEADRDAADKLRAELSSKMALNGMVVAYP
ncbi:MAG TPA: SPOR domain-containing protein [Xanthomonadaceae bacterium]|jgi:DedD protein|nr:SPOR domain-containing protein [Xanthomonadaceae bacterium]